MAIRIEAELNANTKQAQKEVEKLNQKVKDVGKSAKDAGKEITISMSAVNPIVRQLDRYTGGLATKLLDVGKAAKLSGKAMKAALISTGIGALVVALALVVEYWDDIAKLIDGVSSEQEKLLQDTEATLKVQQDQLSATNSMENTLKLQGKSEKEIRDLKRQQTDEIITSTELLLQQQIETKRSQVEAAERNKKIATGIIAFLSMPITILLGAVDALTAGLTKIGVLSEATTLAEGYLDFTSSLIFDPEEVKTEGDKTIEETKNKLAKLKNTRDGFVLQDKADSKKAGEDITNNEIEEARRKAAALESIRKTLIDTEAEERAEKLRKVKEDYDKQILLAEEFYGTETEKVKELKAAQKLAVDEQQAVFDQQDEDKRLADKEAEQEKIIEELELDREFSNQTFEEQKEILSLREEALLNDATLSEEQRTALTAQYADARATIAEEETSAKLAALDAVGNALGSMSKLAGEETATGKALAIAAATISVFTGMANIWAGFNVGTPTPIDVAMKVAGSATVAANGFAAIKNITKTKVPGGRDTSPSTPTASAPASTPMPPAFNIVGQSDTNQLADAIGGQMQQPLQAFVVASEITTAQELERNIIDGASIG